MSIPVGMVGCAMRASGTASVPLSSAHDRHPEQATASRPAAVHFSTQRLVPVALAMNRV